jgi:putative ABC transport system substrate-binding protein
LNQEHQCEQKKGYFNTMPGGVIAAVLILYPIIPGRDDPPKIHRVGVLNYTPVGEPALEGLRKGLGDQGLIEGKDYTLIYSGVIRDKAKLKAEAVRLIGQGINMFYTISTPATLAAKAATRENKIPVVFGPVNSPVKMGIVPNLKQPGANVTGVTFGPQEPRRLGMLHRFKPEIKTVYVPYNPLDKSPRVGIAKLKTAAEKTEDKPPPDGHPQ